MMSRHWKTSRQPFSLQEPEGLMFTKERIGSPHTKGVNISAEKFMSVLDDSLNALEKNNIGQREQEEVLYSLYRMRAHAVRV